MMQKCDLQLQASHSRASVKSNASDEAATWTRGCEWNVPPRKQHNEHKEYAACTAHAARHFVLHDCAQIHQRSLHTATTAAQVHMTASKWSTHTITYTS